MIRLPASLPTTSPWDVVFEAASVVTTTHGVHALAVQTLAPVLKHV